MKKKINDLACLYIFNVEAEEEALTDWCNPNKKSMKTKTELKETYATSHFEIYVECPYCDYYQDRREDLVEYLDGEALSAEECDVELTCSDCGKSFIINEIIY